MFDLNFIAEPGIQTESTEASWSFLDRRTKPEVEKIPKSSSDRSKKVVTNWQYFGFSFCALMLLVIIYPLILHLYFLIQE